MASSEEAPTTTDVPLVAGFRDGEPVHELVPAVKIGENRYRLKATPGFALGVACGDEIELDPAQQLGYRVLRRGGNVGVQVFLQRYTLEERRQLTRMVRELGGWVDGRQGDGSAASLLVFTIPVEAGFGEIERVMTEASRLFAVDEWLYANVYDPMDGVTPLDWWE